MKHNPGIVDIRASLERAEREEGQQSLLSDQGRERPTPNPDLAGVRKG